jgi:cob(I)alamin adenosyltransferase
MSLLKESERVRAGSSITQALTQVTNAVSTIKAVKTQLFQLKDVIAIDTENYTEADVAEVQAQIDEIQKAVDTI